MKRIKSTLMEAVAIAVLGGLLGLGANQLSSKGLDLTRDYFPTPILPPSPASSTGQPPAAPSPEERLTSLGIQSLTYDKVRENYEDPAREEERFLFIDARDDRHYREGHIPGAYQLDHYRIDEYLGPILDACASAEKIVVYCNGGDCEDSEFAAMDLIEAGVEKDLISVYLGGITDWILNKGPVEVGERLSGEYQEYGVGSDE